MAWNEPGNGQRDRDPWNKNKRGAGGKPGIEATLKDVAKRLGKLGGPGGLFTILGIFVLAWLLMTSYTMIGSGQVGVVQRFGAYARTIGPGFHFKLPLPVETVQPVATSRIRAMSDQVRMLTRDEDIVAVDFSVQYQVTDPQKYVFNVRDPDGTLNEAAQAAVSAVIGAQPMDGVLTGQGDANASAPALATLQQQVRDQLQHVLDGYDCGLRVTDVNFQSVSPPQEVKEAFDDVNAARQDRQGLIDQAHAGTSQEVPLANGDAKRLAAEADAYKSERVARAQGDAERFNLILKEYKAAPDVTRRRLWLETMEEILRASNKVIDGSDGRSVINISGEHAEGQPATNLPGVGAVAQPGGDDADKEKQP
ncbi:FtsH protease activity modulator HflK [Dyella mobilis]|uniref:Protein HflK n=1 Tax=Dyella mobilis TaxID=1849582 RepID=A0ABS2KKK1_9GAMM|nr:FtsH protease activity modulator HflK [Dyella mobilis]MBM7131688.1 FtsH protease activity modulator HflK [Dyella mobilis]GLQ96336.1 HflK protein [Dyella mobilis]